MENKRLSNGLLFLFTFYMEMFVMGKRKNAAKQQDNNSNNNEKEQ